MLFGSQLHALLVLAWVRIFLLAWQHHLFILWRPFLWSWGSLSRLRALFSLLFYRVKRVPADVALSWPLVSFSFFFWVSHTRFLRSKTQGNWNQSEPLEKLVWEVAANYGHIWKYLSRLGCIACNFPKSDWRRRRNQPPARIFIALAFSNSS